MIVKEKKTVEQEVITDYICNKCGESCKTGSFGSFKTAFDGLLEVSVRGGYFSKYLIDCHDYKFSLCEKCLVAIISNFIINPLTKQTEYILNEEDREKRWINLKEHWSKTVE